MVYKSSLSTVGLLHGQNLICKNQYNSLPRFRLTTTKLLSVFQVYLKDKCCVTCPIKFALTNTSNLVLRKGGETYWYWLQLNLFGFLDSNMSNKSWTAAQIFATVSTLFLHQLFTVHIESNVGLNTLPRLAIDSY